MYSQNDLVDMKSQIKKFIFTVLAIFAVFLTAAVIIAKQINNNFGMVVIVIGVCIDIFIWGMYGTPILAYYRYIRDIMTGRSRDIKGMVKRVGAKPVYKDNKLLYYEILIEEDGVDRVILLDNQKKWPRIYTDKVYEFQIHENYVLDIREAA